MIRKTFFQLSETALPTFFFFLVINDTCRLTIMVVEQVDCSIREMPPSTGFNGFLQILYTVDLKGYNHYSNTKML